MSEHNHTARINPVVFFTSLVIAIIFVVWGAISPASMKVVSDGILNFTIKNFAWLYVASVMGFLIFVVAIAFSKYGKIRLGKDDERPEYSTFAWLAMLFTTGMGIGLVFWSIAEPLYHYGTPPYGAPKTPEAAELAMRYVFFHWGLHPWGIFALVGLALAYFQFRRGMPGLISSIFHPILGDRIHGPIGNMIDILAVFATVFGLGTSLGLGTMQINSGLSFLYQVPNNPVIQLIIIAVITSVFTGAAVLGIEKGIQFIAKWTVYIALALMTFLFVFGPTKFILDMITNTTGTYLTNLFSMSLWTDPIKQGGWIGSWTIFYWAWWIAWGPFVGQFIARISKGRTVQEFILGVLVVPTLFSFLWLGIFGGTALNLELTGKADIAAVVAKDLASSIFVTLAQYPLAGITSIMTILLIAAFFITSADSGTFVVGMLTSNGSLEPSNKVKGIWGAVIGGVAAVLLLSGGLSALQTASIASAFPFMLVIIVMCYSLMLAFRSDSTIVSDSQRKHNENNF